MKNRNVITDEQVEKHYEALPDNVVEAFESAETSRLLFEIGKKQGLAIDKIGELAREVGYLMLGFVAAGEFIPDLTEILGDQEKAKAVAQEINQKILLPIRESLKKTYGGQWASEEKVIAKPPLPKVVPLPLKPSPGPKPVEMALRPETKKPEPIIIAPLPARMPVKPKEEKPMPAAPKAAAPMPAVAAKPAEPSKPAPSGPQPLIIYPLPMAERIREQGLGVKGRAAPMPEVKTVPQAKPVPQLLPARPPAPPVKTYETAKEAVKKELEEFHKEDAKETLQYDSGQARAAAGVTPSPYVITKEELQKEIERFRQSAADSGKRTPKQSAIADAAGQVADSATRPPAAPTPAPPPPPPAPKSPAPLKLPQEKIPKPPAPESYTMDPYRETAE